MLKYLKVLLIDDEEDDQEIFSEAMQEVFPDVQLHTASNGVEALKLLEENQTISMIFLDLNMPLMNGYEFLTTMRQNILFDRIPVVIHSTAKSDYIIELCRKLGANLFFTKPVNFSVLCERLREILTTHFQVFTIC